MACDLLPSITGGSWETKDTALDLGALLGATPSAFLRPASGVVLATPVMEWRDLDADEQAAIVQRAKAARSSYKPLTA